MRLHEQGIPFWALIPVAISIVAALAAVAFAAPARPAVDAVGAVGMTVGDLDRSVAAMGDFVCGANESGYHFRGANFGRDAREPDRVADLRNVVPGDASPDGRGRLEIIRGIEVGHVFALGNKY